MERLLNSSAIADYIGCTAETARKLMAQMPRINLSPKGVIRPRYAVLESQFVRWLKNRNTQTFVRTVQSRHEKPKLEYRR